MTSNDPAVWFPLAKLARTIGELHNASASTLSRWHRTGVRGVDGKTYKLAAKRVGGRVMSTRQGVLDFLAAINATGQTEVRTPAARQRASEAAASEYDGMVGVK